MYEDHYLACKQVVELPSACNVWPRRALSIQARECCLARIFSTSQAGRLASWQQGRTLLVSLACGTEEETLSADHRLFDPSLTDWALIALPQGLRDFCLFTVEHARSTYLLRFVSAYHYLGKEGVVKWNLDVQ